jgi:hypothetical protein
MRLPMLLCHTNGGDQSATFNSDTILQIGEHQLSLTPNLGRALICFQERLTKPMFLWIDSICINQADMEERGLQVQIMSQIYQSASGVWVWLGPAADNSDLAMDVIDEVSNYPEDMRGEASRSIKWVRRILYESEFSAHRLALQLLFSRPYWQRLWIVQEVVLGACTDSPLVCCGQRVSCLRARNQACEGISCCCGIWWTFSKYHRETSESRRGRD